MSSAAVQSRVSAIPNLDEFLKKKNNFPVEDENFTIWDKGVFINELQRQGIVLETDKNGVLDGDVVANKGLSQGTYKGTQLALTAFYSMVEEASVSEFNSKGFEPIIPVKRELANKQDTYQWSKPDGFPPHLQTIPPDQQAQDIRDPTPQKEGVGLLFNPAKQAVVAQIAAAGSFLVPDNIPHLDTPYVGPTIADTVAFNDANKPAQTDIMNGENLGNLSDWYSDARFAQQHLSGVNPSTIETAPDDKIKAYIQEATKQGRDDIKKILTDNKDLFIQDYSYFRKATGVKDNETFFNIIPNPDAGKSTEINTTRYACAPIVIFQLHGDGRLHPLAITIDYRGSLDKSVTLFNRRLNPDDTKVDEKEDWPWRYAKTCAQTADWARHEIAVHLVDTHLIEEAVIVATNRTVPEDHLLYEILSPHWFRTLALNNAARLFLVPLVINRLAGFGNRPGPDGKPFSRAFDLVNYSYQNFNFQEKYIPNDLKKRGFDIKGKTETKYRNYPYATDMNLLWGAIRDFAKSVLQTKYTSDEDIKKDTVIADWCKEIQEKGQIKTFPTITTVDQLIDAVTMCIHTASPQHTAVNYLQNYYYSFVPSKPPALCTALPEDLKTLQSYTEKQLTEALPIGKKEQKWKDWLLAAQLPELLSYKVDSKYNLITYAMSLYNVNKNRTAFESTQPKFEVIKEAAATLFSRLKELEGIFNQVSKNQTPGTVEYKVLQPELTAVSILI